MNQISNWFKSCLDNKDLVEKIKKIKLVITDIDGCLTDGQSFFSEDGNRAKGFSVQDGYATVHALKSGLLIAFLTGRKDNSVKLRAQQLGIPEDMYFEGFCNGKKEKTAHIQQSKNVDKQEALLFGDDFLDVQCRELVGLFVCPQNSLFYIAHQADLIIPQNGGNHAFRTLLDLILYVQEKHFAQEMINQALGK